MGGRNAWSPQRNRSGPSLELKSPSLFFIMIEFPTRLMPLIMVMTGLDCAHSSLMSPVKGADITETSDIA